MRTDDERVYEVEAFNLASASENKIHDDSVARQFGFSGALVPGVDVYAYACHLIVRRFGRAWLDRGRAECRFLKPVYHGSMVRVSALPEDRRLALKVESQGEICAVGSADLAGTPAPPLSDYEDHRLPMTRPAADEDTLAAGRWLGTRRFEVSPNASQDYLLGIAETNRLYAEEGLAHPGLVLRLCNLTLMDNVLLDVWIHTGSTVENFSAAWVGDLLSARSRVSDNFERKGHRFVELDVLVVANDERPVARVRHTAIYRLRDPA
jgi:acyl dehydratase